MKQQAQLGGVLLRGQLRAPRGSSLRSDSAPPGAHLDYFAGRVVSNIEVVEVVYGTGSFIPEVTGILVWPSMSDFYARLLGSAYVDWLSEYNTTGLPDPTTNQVIGRGSFASQVTISPAPENNGAVIDDSQIQAELSAQIQAGNLPAPTHDAQGNNNTYYAVFFPHGKTITLGGVTSCSEFCAYHGTIADAGGAGEIYYGVHPDFQPGSGCESGCGTAATQFGNYTQVASHELVGTMTDPEIGLAQVIGSPLAWYDQGLKMEIGDICNDQSAEFEASGRTYDVQPEFSNLLNDCIVTSPLRITPPPQEICPGDSTTEGVYIYGGEKRFTSDVTLSLINVSPAPPAGGEITAILDPLVSNPLPTPSDAGSRWQMFIATTAATPPGAYTLTFQGASSTVTLTAALTLVVKSDVPPAVTLPAPPDGAVGVSATPTFSWTQADVNLSYALEIFDGSDCVAPPIRTFVARNRITLQQADALAPFQSFSWRVTSDNYPCHGKATSACFNFQTASCTELQELVTNGGVEAGLIDGWFVPADVPPPIVNRDNPHSGTSAVLLGGLAGSPEPLGDTQVSQIITLPAGVTPTLVFWEWPLTTDSVSYDQQYVRVTPIRPPGDTVVLMNEARDDETYVRREFDMSPFAGMTVELTFGVHQDGYGDVTGMYVDDVSVSFQGCGPPESIIDVTPPRRPSSAPARPAFAAYPSTR